MSVTILWLNEKTQNGRVGCLAVYLLLLGTWEAAVYTLDLSSKNMDIKIIIITINLHAPVTLCSATLVTMYYPRKDEGSGKALHVQSIEPQNIGTHSGLEPGLSGSTVQSSNHYTTAAHTYEMLYTSGGRCK